MNENQLKELLEDMSPEEKVGQLVQLPGSSLVEDAAVTGIIQNSEKSEALGMIGSTLGLSGAKTLIALQKKQMEQQPHHIPMLFMMDVIHGYKTVFPCPLGQGASFSPDLVRECAEIAAKEASVAGIHVVFAPMADLVRDSRWGRVMESTGEDVYLNGKMAEAMVWGFQGDNPGDKGKVAACVKHFAAYGAPVAGREYDNVELSEHTLREFYLPAYEKAVKAGSELVMSGFHTWNGIPCSGNEWLLRKILREEMGFEGVLISDWGAVGEMVGHGYCADKREAAKKALEAGTDIDMCANAYADYLAELIQSGELEESLLDEAVLRVLRLKNRLGLFENPFKDADEEEEKRVILCKEHREIARKAVRESLVLLKNETAAGDRVLPLGQEKLAFVGPYIDGADMDSSWAISGDIADQISIRRAAEEMLPDRTVFFAQGCTMLDNCTAGGRYYYEEDEKVWREKNDRLRREAVATAERADTVILCLGEHRSQSGEAASRSEITLPEIQMELLRHIHETGKRIVTVLFSGRPLDIRVVIKYSDAVLMAWFPGAEGGHGILDVLLGRYNPSGKLPMSMPYCVGQLPISYDQYRTGKSRRKKTPGEYASGYLDIPSEPLYAFGYGLSYTEFSISKPSLDRTEIRPGEGLKASVTVKNEGKTAGTEIVQLYIQDIAASRVRPEKQLKGMERVELQPGEERIVTFSIEEEMLRFYRQDGVFGSEPGKFRLWVENSSNVREGVEFYLEKQ